MNLANNKILITGGATGIGLGLAIRFIEENNQVIIVSRRKSVLEEVAGKNPGIIPRRYDLSIAQEREELYKWISKEHPDLNILVNNAGIQQRMSITDSTFYARAKEEIAINIEAPLHLTELFSNLKSLNTIINITSGLAFVPIAGMPVYCASKAFFHSFTLSLRHQYRTSNIEIIEIIPPALNTDLGGKGLHTNAQPVSEFIEAVFEQLKSGKTEISYGFSETMTKATPDDLQKAFKRMNGA